MPGKGSSVVSNVLPFVNVLEQFTAAVSTPNSGKAKKFIKMFTKSVRSSISGKVPKEGRILALAFVLLVGTGGSLRLRKGHLSVFAPLWVYDIAVKLNFIPNWITGAMTFFLNPYPGPTPNWNTDSALTPAALAKSADAATSADLAVLKESIIADSSGWLAEKSLMQLFDSLPVADADMMRGKAYKGRILRSGCSLDYVDLCLIQPLRMVGVNWGKRYRSAYVGDPLVMTFLNRVHVPQAIWGNVGMHDVSYRGRSHATMMYDHQPWLDMFVVLDDGAISGTIKLLGLWCHRQKCGGWFTLTHQPDIDVTM